MAGEHCELLWKRHDTDYAIESVVGPAVLPFSSFVEPDLAVGLVVGDVGVGGADKVEALWKVEGDDLLGDHRIFYIGGLDAVLR